MNDKQIAIDACNGVQKERMAKAAAAFIDAFFVAESQPEAATQRQSVSERFLIALRVYGEAHRAALELVNRAYPET